ncbi:MAG TPA: hypothetical protein VFA78_06015 [Chloroflexota bacterium]|nr:hypothetical protein [Chloroflexota bacterium]
MPSRMNPSLYIEHFTDTDLALLTRTSGDRDVASFLTHLRADPAHLEVALGTRDLRTVLFEPDEEGALLRASPFLVFAVLVSRVRDDLASASFVEEWIGPHRRMPVFDVGDVREFADDPAHRLFLAEVLASYTRVFSGTAWIRTRRGWRRNRFSDLDPLRLLQLVETVPEPDRPAIYRRVGDLALFLTGVFPDYAAVRLLSLLQRGRLERLIPATQARSDLGNTGDMLLLESLGRRSYRLAGETSEAGTILVDIAAGFRQARRVLNVLTDRYLFPHRRLWFPAPES